jgi:hypothetical protein
LFNVRPLKRVPKTILAYFLNLLKCSGFRAMLYHFPWALGSQFSL